MAKSEYFIKKRGLFGKQFWRQEVVRAPWPHHIMVDDSQQDYRWEGEVKTQDWKVEP
jgi:hypothetical protein